MAANELVQARIDPQVKAQAAAVLELGMTLSDAVRILLTRTAREGALPLELISDPPAYDAWFRAKVCEALDDVRPDVAHEDVDAEFAARRAASVGTAKAWRLVWAQYALEDRRTIYSYIEADDPSAAVLVDTPPRR